MGIIGSLGRQLARPVRRRLVFGGARVYDVSQ